MKINYKQPYWLKFEWDISTHHDNQYVTEFNKQLKHEFDEFLYGDFTILLEFNIDKSYQLDENFAIFGKSSKNMGLIFNKSKNELSFQFRTSNDIAHHISLGELTFGKENNNIAIVREGNKFTVYRDFVEIGSIIMNDDENLCKKYRDTALYLGCSSPSSEKAEYKYHGEMDMTLFTIVNVSLSIEDILELFKTKSEKLLEKPYYNNILSYYNFKTVNNLGLIFDESANVNFLERIPKEYIK